MVTNISSPPSRANDAVPLLALDGEAFASLIAEAEAELEAIEPAGPQAHLPDPQGHQQRRLVDRAEVERGSQTTASRSSISSGFPSPSRSPWRAAPR